MPIIFVFFSAGGGDGFYLNERDAPDGDVTKTSFADLTKIRSNGNQQGMSRCALCTIFLTIRRLMF